MVHNEISIMVVGKDILIVADIDAVRLLTNAIVGTFGHETHEYEKICCKSYQILSLACIHETFSLYKR